MITVELPADVEARLAQEARARGLDLPSYAARLLEAAAASQGAKPATQRTREEFHAWLEQFVQFSDQIPAMPGETFSREMIYRDHD